MIQTVLTFSRNDRTQICETLKGLSIPFFPDGSNKTVTVRVQGSLQLELEIHRLKEKLPGIKFDVSPPEVLFTQSTVKVKVEGPLHLYQYVVKELHKRLPDKEEIEVYIKSKRVEITGRFPIFTVQNLTQRFRDTNSRNELQISMYDFRDSLITESKLREMLNTFVSG